MFISFFLFTHRFRFPNKAGEISPPHYHHRAPTRGATFDEYRLGVLYFHELFEQNTMNPSRSDYLAVSPSAHRFSFLFVAGIFFEKVCEGASGGNLIITTGNIKGIYHRIYMNKAIFSKDHKYTVEQLKKARAEAGLDQVEVAKMLGKTQPHISKIEAGQRRLDITQLKEFAKIYKKSLTYFIK